MESRGVCYVCFSNETATPEIFTLSLHDDLPIWRTHANYLNKNGRRFLDKTPFANFIKPEKSGKSWRYEKGESIRDGRTKRLIAEKASRKNAS